MPKGTQASHPSQIPYLKVLRPVTLHKYHHQRYLGQSPVTDTITKDTQANHPSQIPHPKVLRPVTLDSLFWHCRHYLKAKTKRCNYETQLLSLSHMTLSMMWFCCAVKIAACGKSWNYSSTGWKHVKSMLRKLTCSTLARELQVGSMWCRLLTDQCRLVKRLTER